MLLETNHQNMKRKHKLLKSIRTGLTCSLPTNFMLLPNTKNELDRRLELQVFRPKGRETPSSKKGLYVSEQQPKFKSPFCQGNKYQLCEKPMRYTTYRIRCLTYSTAHFLYRMSRLLSYIKQTMLNRPINASFVEGVATIHRHYASKWQQLTNISADQKVKGKQSSKSQNCDYVLHRQISPNRTQYSNPAKQCKAPNSIFPTYKSLYNLSYVLPGASTHRAGSSHPLGRGPSAEGTGGGWPPAPPWANAAAAVGLRGDKGEGREGGKVILDIVSKYNKKTKNERKKPKPKFDLCFIVICYLFTENENHGR